MPLTQGLVWIGHSLGDDKNQKSPVSLALSVLGTPPAKDEGTINRMRLIKRTMRMKVLFVFYINIHQFLGVVKGSG